MSKNIKTLLHKKTDHSLSLQDHPAPSTTYEGNDKFLLLEVNATALTSGELLWPEVNELAYPIPGMDVAGTILTTPASSRFKTGDRVYGYTAVVRPGAAREQQIALESELALMPEALSWDEAATMPLSALTAWQVLFDHAGLRLQSQQTGSPDSRTRVLVTAASGSVGVWAVQLAHLAGAYVVATCGPKNVDLVKSLGADEVLDYTKTSLSTWAAEDSGRAFDVVIDCKGGAILTEAWKCVKSKGFFNSVAEPPEDLKPATGVAPDVRSKWFIVEPNGGQLAEISKLVEEGKCKAVVDSSWGLGEWQKALERLNSGHARGKVVLRVKQ